MNSYYLQGFKRSLVTYSRIPLRVDWNQQIEHTPAVCFLPWVGLVVAVLSSWPLCFAWSVNLQALFMLLSAVLLTGGFHEDGLMDACDGLVGGWDKEQRLNIMKDSRLGSYGALSIWFALAFKWLLLSELLTGLQSAFGHTLYASLYGLVAWCAVHTIARLVPLVLMNTLDYVSTGQSKAASMIATLAMPEWGIALLPCVLMGGVLGVFDAIGLALLLLLLLVLMRWYLLKKIAGFNGDTLGASEQVAEVVILLCLLGSIT